MDTTPTIDPAALAQLARRRLDAIAGRIERVERALIHGVPLALVHAVLAPDFDAKAPAVRIAERWITERPQGLQVLRGGLGTGKSVGAAVYAIATGARWVSASEVASWTYADQGARSARWVEAPDLVIDEVGGQGTTSPVEAGRLALVILARWTALRPTLLTSNLARTAFASVYDGALAEAHSRILDRLRERGDWQDVKGASRRAKPADLEAGRKRFEDWRRLVRLVDAVELAAAGYEVEGLAETTARLAALIQATPEEMAEATAAIADRQQRMDDFARPYLQRWAEERAERDAETEQQLDAMRALIMRHVGAR